MRVAAALVVGCGHAAGQLADAMLGTWRATTVPQSVLGPISSNGPTRFLNDFTAAKDPATGEYWMSLLAGQTWRIKDEKMQYCFIGAAQASSGTGGEQSPFQLHTSDDKKVEWCWRTDDDAPVHSNGTWGGMPTHKAGCSGCDCGKVSLTLTGDDTMEFLFQQSPPVVHAHVIMKRYSAPPAAPGYYRKILNKASCEFENHTGSLHPQGEAAGSAVAPKGPHPSCAANILSMLRNDTVDMAADEARFHAGLEAGSAICWQLNGVNHLLGSPVGTIPDVRMQYNLPSAPCNPCSVAYTVTAAVDTTNEYIAIGFQGLNYFYYPDWSTKIRPNYFGMTTDDEDKHTTTDLIALGYAGASCLREMRAENFVGTPTDVSPSEASFTDTSVEVAKGKTVIKFSVPQYWGTTDAAIKAFASNMRVMWAIGSVEGGSGKCDEMVGFHTLHRGVSPQYWLGVGNLKC